MQPCPPGLRRLLAIRTVCQHRAPQNRLPRRFGRQWPLARRQIRPATRPMRQPIGAVYLIFIPLIGQAQAQIVQSAAVPLAIHPQLRVEYGKARIIQ